MNQIILLRTKRAESLSLVFSHHTLEFFEHHPQYLEAILAHELGHLKYDLKRLRRLRIISRLGLVGVGFLGVTLDPIVMEDKADRFARAYLCRKGLDENLVAEAAKAIEVWDYLAKVDANNDLNSVAFQSRINLEKIGENREGKTIFRAVMNTLSAAYNVYFKTELYYYLHRQAKHRQVQYKA